MSRIEEDKIIDFQGFVKQRIKELKQKLVSINDPLQRLVVSQDLIKYSKVGSSKDYVQALFTKAIILSECSMPDQAKEHVKIALSSLDSPDLELRANMLRFFG